MKLYSSFLLRCWVIRDETETIAPEKMGMEKIVFDIEQIQTGARRRTAAPEEALQWILAACQNSQPEDVTEEPEEAAPPFQHAKQYP